MALTDASVSASDTSVFTAERVAEALQRQVTEGALRSDDRLKDQELAQQFGVSRNTAREALRLMAAEGLVALRLHSGAAVRRLKLDDVRDIYRVRRTLECSAVMASSTAPEHLFVAIEQAVARAEQYVEQNSWSLVGTASLEFHRAIVALHDSRRMEKFFAQQLAQLRLAFWALPNESEFQQDWIPRDREIVDLLLGGQRERAAVELLQYLNDSEARVIDALRAAARRLPHTTRGY